jgi:hypothetical protein
MKHFTFAVVIMCLYTKLHTHTHFFVREISLEKTGLHGSHQVSELKLDKERELEEKTQRGEHGL